MSKKNKIKMIHLFMAMMLLFGLIQPGIVIAEVNSNQEDVSAVAAVETKEEADETTENFPEDLETFEESDIEDSDISEVNDEEPSVNESKLEEESPEGENATDN